MNLKIGVLVILLFALRNVFPQESFVPDTIPADNVPGEISFFFQDFESLGTESIFKKDTTFNFIQRYEPAFQRNAYYAYLGNPGLAHSNLVYIPMLASGFNSGFQSFNRNAFTSDSTKYYLVSRPYTSIGYVMGPKREQTLRVIHAQDVSSWFSAGLHFNYVSSPGLYRNQKGDDKNFVFNTRFQTRNFRYMVLANYMHNKLKMQENGGIQYDTVFEQNVITSRDGIPVNLNTAKNEMKENSLFIKQLFNLSNKTKFLSTDSSGTNPHRRRKGLGVLAYSFQYSKTTFLYEHTLQDNNGFYQFTYDSVNETYDSSHIFKIENQLSWTNADPSSGQPMTATLKLRHQYIEHSVDSMHFIYNLFIPTADIRVRFSNVIHLQLFGDYIVGNEYSGDYNLRGKLLMKTEVGDFFYNVKYAAQEVPRLFQFYRSNHFIWDNNLKKQQFLINSIGYDRKSFRAGINFNSIDNFVYFDKDALPSQLGTNLNVFQGQVSKIFQFGHFTIDGQLVYQLASQTESIRLPEWIADMSVYFSKPLFRGATTIQTGFDLFYYSSYFAYGYMPATRSFYIQDQKKIGDYLYADLFLNLKIKRAYLFLKYNNIGFLLSDFRYYTVPAYPMKDGAFRFGVAWSFYD